MHRPAFGMLGGAGTAGSGMMMMGGGGGGGGGSGEGGVLSQQSVTGAKASSSAAAAAGAAAAPSSSMLFRKQVLVRIRSQEREERAEMLCVTVALNAATRDKPVKVCTFLPRPVPYHELLGDGLKETHDVCP